MKLPWWRVVLGFGVLAALITVLISLAPFYLRDYDLREYMKNLPSQSAADEDVRNLVVRRAHELDLPVRTGDVTVSHPDGRRKVEAKYVVDVNLAVYQVDLHFHPWAER